MTCGVIHMQYNPFRQTKYVPFVTYTIAAINVIMFGIEFLMGSTTDTRVLIQLGAKVDELIAAGQYWRLVTPIVLHAGFEHLLFNSIALLIWGQHAEMLLGRIKYIICYLVAGISGSLLSFALSASVSIGASGAIFGIFGIFLYLWHSNKQLFNRVFGIQVLIIIGINLVAGFTTPNVDNFGHIGGLIGGFLCAQCAGLRLEQHGYTRRILFGALLLAFMAACFAVGMYRWG